MTKLKVFVDDIKKSGVKKHVDVLQTVPKAVSKLNSVLHEAKFKLPLTEGKWQNI